MGGNLDGHPSFLYLKSPLPRRLSLATPTTDTNSMSSLIKFLYTCSLHPQDKTQVGGGKPSELGIGACTGSRDALAL